ncbi:hypothetical protein [Actinacidiphila oryziradicis]|nr:hypothetical protein [Actinacidiphila oryziradicis]
MARDPARPPGYVSVQATRPQTLAHGLPATAVPGAAGGGVRAFFRETLRG